MILHPAAQALAQFCGTAGACLKAGECDIKIVPLRALRINKCNDTAAFAVNHSWWAEAL